MVAERRVAEMAEVVATLQDMGIDSSVSAATRRKLQALADLDLKTLFSHKPPEHFSQVLDAILQSAGKQAT